MNKTKKIVYTALLTALCVVANFLTIPIGNDKFVSLTVCICIIGGVYLGWLSGAAIGFLGDLIAHFIHPYGAYNLFIGISCAMFGVIAALVFRLNRVGVVVKICITVALCFVVCSCVLNTFGLWLQYIVGVPADFIGLWQFFALDKSGIKKSFWVYLLGRMPLQAINAVVNGALAFAVLKSNLLSKLIGTPTKE